MMIKEQLNIKREKQKHQSRWHTSWNNTRIVTASCNELCVVFVSSYGILLPLHINMIGLINITSHVNRLPNIHEKTRTLSTLLDTRKGKGGRN